MLLTYPYIRPRRQFGKQCVFLFKEKVATQAILPEPELLENYIVRSTRNNYTQTPHQVAAHEVQTDRKEMKNSGVLHIEGGWPREVNPWDNEAVYRVRRRIERGDQYSASMQALIPPMEHCILQNSAINIYDHFFDDLIPIGLTSNYNMRIRNIYEGPEPVSRPIRELSWCPTAGNRLAAAYSFTEFEFHLNDHNANPCSYVWDIENPLIPLSALRSPSHVITLQFNPRDPSILVGGYISGLTCVWDIRYGSEPVLSSLRVASHRYPVTQTLWITSKAHTEFFSASLDGSVLWWDTRFLKTPTESLIMDLDNPGRSDIYRAVGITSMHFEPTISSRFLVGTERGEVVNVNRRSNTPLEKLSMRFDCHDGSVISVDRNPSYPKNFLTIGDCSAKIWADDTREGFFFRTRDNDPDLSGGCWSRTKASIFFTINTEGVLNAYDVVWGMKAPVASLDITTKNLTAISSHDDGKFVAIGAQDGNVYLVECSVGMTKFSREDKASFSASMERSSKYEKVVDNRVKEIKHALDLDTLPPPQRSPTPPPTRRASLTKSEKIDRPRKLKRTKSRRSTVVSGIEFISAEAKYFQIIDKYESTFVEIAAEDEEAARVLLEKRATLREQPEEEEDKEEERSLTSQRSRRLYSKRRPVRDRSRRLESKEPAELPLETESELLKKRRAKKRRPKKICDTVCKPDICCMDMEEKQRQQIEKMKKKFAHQVSEEKKVRHQASFVLADQYYRRLSQYVNQIPNQPMDVKKKILMEKNQPPVMLNKELMNAKREIRKLHKFVISGKICSQGSVLKLNAVSLTELEENPEMAAERVIELKMEEKKISKQVSKSKLRKKKGKKLTLSTDDLAKIQEDQERANLEMKWLKLKQKLKEMESREKLAYPRISAAHEKRSSEDVIEGLQRQSGGWMKRRSTKDSESN